MDCPTGADPALQEPLGCDAVLEATGAAAAVGERSLLGAETWRGEVAVRLERYRARRKPRAPRYPSLLLPFESPENWSRPLSEANGAGAQEPMPTSESIALQMEEQPAAEQAPRIVASHPAMANEPASIKVIEFPRSAAIPMAWIAELAEPIMDRPRIVEAPEVLPPPPALGGILMEPATNKEENRSGAELPQSPASITQRLLAGLVDSLILGAALAAFAAIFLRLNPARAPLPVLLAGFLVVAVLWWAAYEFLFVVYTGSTPGLRALRVRLVKFDGSPVDRRVRRWRVLASFLSACSLGLGYLWSVLDEDGLCWHDRITRTHIRSRDQAK